MPALADLQALVRDTVLGGNAGALRGIVADDRLGHARRLQVYRNNTTILLSEALGANFSVVRTLVGEDFFLSLAKRFVRLHPPRTPCLFEYGADFPDFIASDPAAVDLGYLADVARLEWLMAEAVHAADAPVLDTGALARVEANDYGRVAFAPHPALRVITSDFPIHAIWALHQPDADPDARVNVDQGGEAVMVTRPGVDVVLTVLPAGDVEFTQHLRAGARLGEAFAAAQQNDAIFNPAETLATVLGQGAFAGFTLD